MHNGLIVRDSGWAWVVVFGAFISHFLTCGFERGYSMLYVELIRKYNTSAALASGLGGLSAAIRLLLAPISVSLCHALNEQKVVIFGGLLTFCGLLISAYSQHFYAVVFGYGIIFGFGLTLVYTPSLIICTTYFYKRRATALSLSLSGCGFAAIVVPYIFYFILRKYEVDGALLILSSISLHYCVAGALYYQPIDRECGVTIKPDTIVITPVQNYFDKMKRGFLSIFNLKIASGFWVKIFLFSFVFNMMGSGPVTTLLIHYAEQHNLLIVSSVLLLVIEGTMQFIIRIACGFIFDSKFIKPHRGLIWTAGIFFSSVVIILLAFASDIYFLSILMLLRGIFLAVYISQQAVVTADWCENEPESTNHTIGMTQIGKGIGILLGSLLSGMIKDYTNDYRPAFIFLGTMQFIGFLMALVSKLSQENKIPFFSIHKANQEIIKTLIRNNTDSEFKASASSNVEQVEYENNMLMSPTISNPLSDFMNSENNSSNEICVDKLIKV